MRRSLITLTLVALFAAVLPATAATPTTKTVKLESTYFQQGSRVLGTVTLKRGDSIRFRWMNDVTHNVRGTTRGQRFDSGFKTSGTYTRRFRNAGRFKLVCDVHGAMVMTARVK